MGLGMSTGPAIGGFLYSVGNCVLSVLKFPIFHLDTRKLKCFFLDSWVGLPCHF